MAKRYQSTYVGFNNVLQSRDKRHSRVIPDDIFEEIQTAGYPNVTEVEGPFVAPYPSFDGPYIQPKSIITTDVVEDSGEETPPTPGGNETPPDENPEPEEPPV